MKPMPTQSHPTIAAAFHRRSHGMDEALKAGIGGTACSVVLLTIVFVAMHLLPLSGGS
jgi:hypothetical protein